MIDKKKEIELKNNIKIRIDKVLKLQDQILPIVKEIRIYRKQLETMWEEEERTKGMLYARKSENQ